jgi:hypothetical protein
MPGLVSAMVYRRKNAACEPPPMAYLDVIRQGYDDFGLDTRLLQRIADQSFEATRQL